jgi:hypothetical protein
MTKIGKKEQVRINVNATEFRDTIMKLARREKRTISGMASVLIYEALVSRGELKSEEDE